MKILVIEDSELHQKAAIAQLGTEHELTVASTYDDGQRALGYFPFKWGQEQCSNKHDFDAVLIDLMLPASGSKQATTALVGQEMPLGTFLVLLAAKNATKDCLIALTTNTNHHDHPASACMDAFIRDDEMRAEVFTLGRARLSLLNTRNMMVCDGVDLAREAERAGVFVKDWKGTLEHLSMSIHR